MEKMIHEYEIARALLLTRIHEINQILHEQKLMTQERELLEHRREVLTIESVDLLHGIIEMRRHV